MENFRQSLDDLSNTVLENTGVYREYSDEDLSNTVIILQEVFMAKMYTYHKAKLTTKQLEQLVEEAGKSIRQTMFLFTGIDMHDVYNSKTTE